MGNCLQCFQSDAQSVTNTAATASCAPTKSEARFTNTNERSYETDELLAPRSPLKNANNCDIKKNSFIKASVLANGGNATAITDIAATNNAAAVAATAAANATTVVNESLEVSDNTLNQLFEEYKDPEEDTILTEGIERLCKDLNYQPDEFAILVLAWCLDASQMYRFTKAEFIEGLHKMCADSIETIQKRLQQTIEMLKVDAEMFKQLYRFTFRFGLEPDQRILLLDMAICLWKLVFTVHTPDLLDNWIHFLEQHPSIRCIPKDTWNMFLNFSEQCDINNYDDTEAWPSLFDDFVDYEKSRICPVGAETPSTAHDDDNNNDDPLQTHPKITIDMRAAHDAL